MSHTTDNFISKQDLYTKSVRNLSNHLGDIKEKKPLKVVMDIDNFIFRAVKKLSK